MPRCALPRASISRFISWKHASSTNGAIPVAAVIVADGSFRMVRG
jgi:hypothetical protein